MHAPDFAANLQKYAEVIVKVGLNLQAGQRLLILYPDLETAPLVRLITELAYHKGCRYVDVIWDDDPLTLVRFKSAPRDSFEEYPAYIAKYALECAERGDACLMISGRDPDLLKDQDVELIGIYQQTEARHFQPFDDLLFRDAMNWSIACYPNSGWAAKVFPNEATEDRASRLWNTIFEICRVKEADPIAAWQQHAAHLAKRCEFLNTSRYSALRFTAPGTDLTVGLADGHVWVGGAMESMTGISFIANLPTEEVCTLPHRDRINGVVTASKPFSHSRVLIENLSLTFHEGRVVDYTATSGEEVLRKTLEIDPGARRLGEVALVPQSSPVSQSGILFYNTIIDENAASHIALGNGFKITHCDGHSISDENFTTAGGNTSQIHADLMIGSDQMDVDGLRDNDAAEPIMRHGEWAFDA